MRGRDAKARVPPTPTPYPPLPTPFFKNKGNYEAHSHSTFRFLFHLDGFAVRQRSGNKDRRKQREEATRRDRRRSTLHFLCFLGRSEEADPLSAADIQRHGSHAWLPAREGRRRTH